MVDLGQAGSEDGLGLIAGCGLRIINDRSGDHGYTESSNWVVKNVARVR